MTDPELQRAVLKYLEQIGLRMGGLMPRDSRAVVGRKYICMFMCEGFVLSVCYQLYIRVVSWYQNSMFIVFCRKICCVPVLPAARLVPR